MNLVIITGRLGQDVELNHTNGGTAYASISVATNSSYKDANGNKVEQTQWHRIKVWGKTAELCAKYLSKGRMATFTGELQYSEYNDKDGVKRYSTEIRSSRVEFLGDNKGSSVQPANVSNAQSPAGNPVEPQVNQDFTGDDIPF